MGFVINDRVEIIDPKSSYKGKNFGKIGTIEQIYEGSCRGGENIGISIDGDRNNSSTKGLYYYRSNQIKKVSISLPPPTVWEDHDGYCFAEILTNKNTYDNEGEKKEMKTKEIIDLWRDYALENSAEYMENCKMEIINNDRYIIEINSKINSLNTTLQEINPDNEICFNMCQLHSSTQSFLTKDSISEIQALEKEIDKFNSGIMFTYNELKTMLSACETYDQEMQILFNYNIVDEHYVLMKRLIH